MTKQYNTSTGIVTEALANYRFNIQLENGAIVQAYLGGKLKLHHIQVRIGDRVEFVVDTIGKNNRICKRF
jgi:translation initiation factor IF-1